MAVVTIPFDYETGRYRRGLIPICISDTDEYGQQIEWRWFEAAAKMADYLRSLARLRLRDVWRVSELAELSIHANGRNHAGKEVRRPDRLVAAYARWTAEDLRCGDHRLRKCTEVLLGDGDRNLVDPFDQAASILNVRALDECREALRRQGPGNLAVTFDMRLSGHSWEEIADALGCEVDERGRKLLSVRLSRAIRRVVR